LHSGTSLIYIYFPVLLLTQAIMPLMGLERVVSWRVGHLLVSFCKTPPNYLLYLSMAALISHVMTDADCGCI
jgi:hypothetical protein